MKHADRVMTAVASTQSAAHSRIAASWRRSVNHYGLDPSVRPHQNILSQSELRGHRDAVGALRDIAGPKLEQLFKLVCASGCAVVLTDKQGVILERRCDGADTQAFAFWGLLPGANWSERSEGTNGIGTCLAEERSVIVHRDQHFYSKNTGMSCVDAPIYGPRGDLIGAVDISSARADQTETINKLMCAMATQTTKQIEAALFKDAFPHARMVLTDEEDTDRGALLAIDSDDIIVGATRGARQKFGWHPKGTFQPIPATDILGRTDHMIGFDRGERAAVLRALTRSKGNISAAARHLAIGRATLYRRMQRLGLARKS